MATATTKGRPDSQSLTKSRSLTRKPKPAGSLSEHKASSDRTDHRPEKPLPNYLKPTISSRPDPAKYLKKSKNGLDEHQKLLRRRSFDRPPSSPSTSSPRLQKSLDISSGHPRDRPSVPRDKPVSGLRSSSSHGSKTSPRGGGTVKSPPSGPKGSHGTKKSGLSTSGSSLHRKKEGSSAKVSKKSSDKEIIRETSFATPAHEEEREIVKVETDVTASDDREEPKSEDKEVQTEDVQSNESGEEKKETDQTDASPVSDSPGDTKEEEEVINEDNTVEQIEEAKAPEDNLDDKGEGEEEITMKVDEESSNTVDADVQETTTVKESTDKEKAGDKEQKQETESSTITEETPETEAVVAALPEGTKRQVVQGKKETPSAYNDVIEKTASKLLEDRKNKVKALVGAFETVIDYETAASK